MNDLERIALGERHVGERRARHDVAVALDRNLLDVEAERRDEIGDAAFAHLPGFAVEDDRNHGEIRLALPRSEEHTSELQSLMRISYAVFCLKKTNYSTHHNSTHVSSPPRGNVAN